MRNQLQTFLKDTNIYVIHAVKGYEFQEQHVKDLFSKYNLDFEFVTDGDPTLTNRSILEDHFTEEFIERTSAGQMSCTLNHILAFKKFIASNKKYAIVFENDPFFLNNFEANLFRVYQEMEQIEEGFIVSLENTTLRFPSFFQLKKNQSLYQAKVGRMAGAYLIDAAGAEKSIAHLQTQKCKDIVDWWHNSLIESNIIKMYWAHPPLTEQGSHNGLMSGTISSKSKSTWRRVRWKFRKFYRFYMLRFKNERRIIEK